MLGLWPNRKRRNNPCLRFSTEASSIEMNFSGMFFRMSQAAFFASKEDSASICQRLQRTRYFIGWDWEEIDAFTKAAGFQVETRQRSTWTSRYDMKALSDVRGRGGNKRRRGLNIYILGYLGIHFAILFCSSFCRGFW